MLDVFIRLDLCEYLFLERWETSSIEQMQEVLEEDDVGSFVQFRSHCVTHGLSVCAIVFISCDTWMSVTYPWTRPHASLSVVSHTCVPCVSAFLQSWVLCGSL